LLPALAPGAADDRVAALDPPPHAVIIAPVASSATMARPRRHSRPRTRGGPAALRVDAAGSSFC